MIDGFDLEVVRALKLRAAARGRSAEAEHREILRQVLAGPHSSLTRRRDPAAAAGLEGWLGALVASHAERILPVDLRVAEEWGRLMARRSLPVVDGLMAATALVHGLTLVTRNVRDVAGTGAVVLNPFVKLRPQTP